MANTTPPSSDAAPSSFRTKLTGSWRLLTFKLINPTTGIEHHPFSETPHGSLVYTSDGYMSSHLFNPTTVPNFAAGWIAPTADEALALCRGMQGYTGRFFLDEKPGEMEQTVYHEIRISNPPNLVGGVQKRNVAVREEGEGGTLRAVITVDEEVVAWDGMRGFLWIEWVKEEENRARRPPEGEAGRVQRFGER